MVDSTTRRPSAGGSRRQPPPCTKEPVPPGLFPFAPRRLASTIRTQAGSRGRGTNQLVRYGRPLKHTSPSSMPFVRLPRQREPARRPTTATAQPRSAALQVEPNGALGLARRGLDLEVERAVVV